MAVPGPYSWEPHVAAWAAVGAISAAVPLAHLKVRGAAGGSPWERRRVLCFVGGAASLVVALTWPVADLAAHWSLTLLVVQRVLLVLLAAPLLWLGLPDDLVRLLTRPPLVDAVLARLLRAPVAVAVVTVVSVGSMAPALVRAQASSALVRALLDAALLGAGLVLWLPVLGRLPGTARPKPVVRFGYLVFQAVVPAFLSFIYIFSTHPLYGTFSRSRAAIHVRPLTDQQMAGFVSKLSMLIVLLTVGAVVLARASKDDDELLEEPLVWADVERAFERADRRRRRGGLAAEDAQVDGGRDGRPGSSVDWTQENLERPDGDQHDAR